MDLESLAGLSHTEPAKERIEEAKNTGAAAIVTVCPWCEKNFTDAIDTMGEKMKVLDFIELVQQAM